MSMNSHNDLINFLIYRDHMMRQINANNTLNTIAYLQLLENNQIGLSKNLSNGNHSFDVYERSNANFNYLNNFGSQQLEVQRYIQSLLMNQANYRSLLPVFPQQTFVQNYIFNQYNNTVGTDLNTGNTANTLKKEKTIETISNSEQKNDYGIESTHHFNAQQINLIDHNFKINNVKDKDNSTSLQTITEKENKKINSTDGVSNNAYSMLILYYLLRA